VLRIPLCPTGGATSSFTYCVGLHVAAAGCVERLSHGTRYHLLWPAAAQEHDLNRKWSMCAEWRHVSNVACHVSWLQVSHPKSHCAPLTCRSLCCALLRSVLLQPYLWSSHSCHPPGSRTPPRRQTADAVPFHGNSRILAADACRQLQLGGLGVALEEEVIIPDGVFCASRVGVSPKTFHLLLHEQTQSQEQSAGTNQVLAVSQLGFGRNAPHFHAAAVAAGGSHDFWWGSGGCHTQ
jgi:hypothetical protein